MSHIGEKWCCDCVNFKYGKCKIHRNWKKRDNNDCKDYEIDPDEPAGGYGV